MARQKTQSDAKGKAGERKLSVKRLPVKDLNSPKTKDVKGGASLRIRRD